MFGAPTCSLLIRALTGHCNGLEQFLEDLGGVILLRAWRRVGIRCVIVILPDTKKGSKSSGYKYPVWIAIDFSDCLRRVGYWEGRTDVLQASTILVRVRNLSEHSSPSEKHSCLGGQFIFSGTKKK